MRQMLHGELKSVLPPHDAYKGKITDMAERKQVLANKEIMSGVFIKNTDRITK